MDVVDSYTLQLQQLLPPGNAWPREWDSIMTAVLATIADELALVEQRAKALLDEADPRSAFDLLADWERNYSLPNSCVQVEKTTEERRAALVAAVTARGGATRKYLRDVARSLGYSITFTWVSANVWQVNAASITVVERSCGSGMGESFAWWGNDILECIINKLKPAHINVLFAYS